MKLKFESIGYTPEEPYYAIVFVPTVVLARDDKANALSLCWLAWALVLEWAHNRVIQ